MKGEVPEPIEVNTSKMAQPVGEDELGGGECFE